MTLSACKMKVYNDSRDSRNPLRAISKKGDTEPFHLERKRNTMNVKRTQPGEHHINAGNMQVMMYWENILSSFANMPLCKWTNFNFKSSTQTLSFYYPRCDLFDLWKNVQHIFFGL